MRAEATKTAPTACPRCGPTLQDIAASRAIENISAHVLTCVRLACGHIWHRTVRNIGGIFPGSPRNATFAPCDCPARNGSDIAT
jgi:hypothetical protein